MAYFEWRAARRRRRFAGVVLVLLICFAVFTPLISPYTSTEQNIAMRLSAPGTEGHVFGTDEFGRDVATRMAFGTRSAALTAGGGVLLALFIGIPLGIAAGLERRVLDPVLSLVIDALLSFPGVLLAIALLAVLGTGTAQVSLALGIMFAPLYARTARSETLAVSAEPFVTVSKGLGSHPLYTVWLHVLPNVLPQALVLSASVAAVSITIEAALSFLGLGLAPPAASWGLMLRDARNYLGTAPWLALLPGIQLGLSVFALNTLGDALAERFLHSHQ
ncbi:MAG: ABC transporter permease [Spirochaetaceae bacterium]|nr:MAG: ABC transporter permease [Spirochaetaceae bacterium]